MLWPYKSLHGMVNKDSPANQARAIEAVGWLGGSPGEGHVASIFLTSLVAEHSGGALHRLVTDALRTMAQHVWSELGAGVEDWRSWPAVGPVALADSRPHVLASAHFTPFRWFWTKWSTLCDPANEWREALPARRFTDWSLCLLRTALAFAYIWEAEFFPPPSSSYRRNARRDEPSGDFSPCGQKFHTEWRTPSINRTRRSASVRKEFVAGTRSSLDARLHGARGN